jgi:hypothetical protein
LLERRLCSVFALRQVRAEHCLFGAGLRHVSPRVGKRGDGQHVAQNQRARLRTVDAIAVAQPKRALLTHMDQSMDYATVASKLPDGVAPAFDGQRISLS